MQLNGYHINNLKSYRKYFVLKDAVRALENGSYREWLEQMLDGMERKKETGRKDYQTGKELWSLLKEADGKEEKTAGEAKKRKMLLLTYELAHLPADAKELDRQLSIIRDRRNRSVSQEGGEAYIAAITEAEYILSLFRQLPESGVWPPYEWKKLVNKTDVFAEVLIMDGKEMLSRRTLSPGGTVWFLSRERRFVKWGRRVRVHGREFACVDRDGHLTVNGCPVRGSGMVDFSFDRRTGILGVDKEYRLRQYSALELDAKEETALAWISGKSYILAGRGGSLRSGGFKNSLPDLPGEDFSWKPYFPEDFGGPAPEVAGELPFLPSAVSLSEELLGFETTDSLTGVWDRKQKKIIWMEG